MPVGARRGPNRRTVPALVSRLADSLSQNERTLRSVNENNRSSQQESRRSTFRCELEPTHLGPGSHRRVRWSFLSCACCAVGAVATAGAEPRDDSRCLLAASGCLAPAVGNERRCSYEEVRGSNRPSSLRSAAEESELVNPRYCDPWVGFGLPRRVGFRQPAQSCSDARAAISAAVSFSRRALSIHSWSKGSFTRPPRSP